MTMALRRPLRIAAAVLALCVGLVSPPASGAGDLLVAPTRVVLDGARGTEVILNNIGAETATYRISLELRRMKEDGQLEDVAPEGADAREAAALQMVTYAPRRVTLAPNQPQSIRIGIRPPAGLADGEYRVHMLFRAIPDAVPAAEANPAKGGFSIALTPIYGVTIPVIVRQGSLQATAALADPKLVATANGKALSFTLTRAGDRSVYGAIRVLKPGQADPVFAARGVAVYAEIGQRIVTLPVSDDLAATMAGPVTIQYVEESDSGGRVLAEVKSVLR